MKAVSRLVMALVLSCLSCAAYAQDVDTTDFNALKYTLQKRWRPRNAPFVNGKFSDNLSLRLDAGTEQLLKRSTSDYSLGPIFRLSLGKDVNCLNNVFAGASAGMFRRNSDGVKVFRGGLELGHSFDIASCLWGYDPDRKYGIRTVEAVGVNLSRASGKYSFSASARVGLSLSATIARDFEVFFQPDVTFYTDGIDCSTASNWQKFDFCYGFSIGTLWHFNRYRENPVTDRTFGEWFTEDAWVFFSGGSNFQISQLVLARPGLFHSARESVQVGYGRHILGPLAVELALFYSRDVWKQFSGLRDKFCYYAGLRPQVSFDPLWWAGIGWFSMPVLAGPEIGFIQKQDDGYSISRVYMGLSLALRPDFAVHRHLSLYFEPRFSMVPYTFSPRTNSTLVTGSCNYYDMLLSLSVGMRIPF